MDEVIPGLFVSGIAAARSRHDLEAHGIQRVLDLTLGNNDDCRSVGDRVLNVEDVKHIQKGDVALVYERVPMADSAFFSLDSTSGGGSKVSNKCGCLIRALSFVESARRDCVPCLVHCHAGSSRSGAIAVAATMRAFGCGYDDALARCKRIRSAIKPNAGFEVQLRSMEPLWGHQHASPNLSSAQAMTITDAGGGIRVRGGKIAHEKLAVLGAEMANEAVARAMMVAETAAIEASSGGTVAKEKALPSFEALAAIMTDAVAHFLEPQPPSAIAEATSVADFEMKQWPPSQLRDIDGLGDVVIGAWDGF